MTRALSLTLCFLGFGCTPPSSRAPVGYDYDEDSPTESQAGPKNAHAQKPVPEDIVARSAGPVTAYSLASSEQIAEGALARDLLAADAICLGEEHDSPEQHYLELWLVDLLAARVPSLGLELGVGFEMFQKPFQKVLSDYQRGTIDGDELLRASEYRERWGFPFAYYRPILERAREHKLALVALNARKELTRSVAKLGLDGLDPDESRQLPELDLDHTEHRASFQRNMEGHPGLTKDKLDNYYAAQVVWDETMAEQGARWLAVHAPIRRLLILAGRAHCQRSAIPERIERRGIGRVVPVLLGTQKPPAEAKAEFDYALVVGAGEKG